MLPSFGDQVATRICQAQVTFPGEREGGETTLLPCCPSSLKLLTSSSPFFYPRAACSSDRLLHYFQSSPLNLAGGREGRMELHSLVWIRIFA